MDNENKMNAQDETIMNPFVFEATTEQHLNIATECHHDWYLQAGYIAPYPEGKYLDEWSKYSKYFLVAQTGNRAGVMKKDVIGVVRLILSAPFPINMHFDLWQQECSEPHNISLKNQCEVAALCWAPKCGKKVFPFLFRAIRQCTKTLNKSIIWACVDRRLLTILKYQRIPFHICGETRFYMGSDTIPLFMKSSEVISSISENKPELVEIIDKELDLLS